MMTSELTDDMDAFAMAAEGAMLSESGDTAGALTRFRAAVEMSPSTLSLHLILANAETLAGDVLGARATLRRALRVAARPDVATDFVLGRALMEAGAGADAVPCFRRARIERPNDAAAAAALAAALRDAQAPDAAWVEIRHARSLTPDDPVVLLTAAMIRHDLADHHGALALCQRSLTLRPDSAAARLTRCYLHHLLGDSLAAWRDFEARALPEPHDDARRWQGESLAGSTIAILGEQGVGDQFHFLRFVLHPAFHDASRVLVTCEPDAVTLLRAAGFDAVPRNAEIETDFYVPLLSLPLLLGVDADWLPSTGSAAYLSVPDAVAIEHVRPRRVGVVWAGNPAHRNDAARSISSALLDGLLHRHPDVRFVCMQHDVAPAAMPSGPWETNAAGDWLETARQLCTLDLLITVDTGIAHLAAALGVRTWILLPHVSDWRWGVSGPTTPWYPSVRLFRQPARGDWARVLTNVSAALSGAALAPV